MTIVSYDITRNSYLARKFNKTKSCKKPSSMFEADGQQVECPLKFDFKFG